MYYNNNYDAGQFFAWMGTYLACVLVFALVMFVLMVVAYWKILQKAGYNGAWALLVLVPGINGIASIGILLFLAFSEWPSLRAVPRGGPAYIPPPAYPPTAPPPGPGYAPPGYAPPAPPMAQAAPPVAPTVPLVAPVPAPVAPPAMAEPAPAAPPVEAVAAPPAEPPSAAEERVAPPTDSAGTPPTIPPDAPA